MSPIPTARASRFTILVFAGALLVALVSARAKLGGWNDGSRLAMVECLVDYHTLAIDRSVFCEPPPGMEALGTPDPVGIRLMKTRDKLFIRGHYYSDKTPVPGLLLTPVYQVWKWCTGRSAHEAPDAFVQWMAFWSSGSAYIVAVACLYWIGGELGLCLPDRLCLTASFGLATMAPVYACHVNNHSLLLAVGMAVLLWLLKLRHALGAGRPVGQKLAIIGTLAGLGYTIDGGVGPLLLLGTLAVVVWRVWSPRAIFLVGMTALPWVFLHHGLNYATGGTFRPANANPEYFNWPDCPFTVHNMTGVINHAGPLEFLWYAFKMMVSQRGFLTHDLPLFLAVAGAGWLLWRRPAELPELLFAVGWSLGTFLLYAVASNNYAGVSRTIRWLIPLLAPAYFVIGLLLRECRGLRVDLLILSAWGLVLTADKWRWGEFDCSVGPYYWPLVGGALGSWLGYRSWYARQEVTTPVQKNMRTAA